MSVESIEDHVYCQPLHRELLLEILAFCAQRRRLEDIEGKVMASPFYPQATRSPFSLIAELEQQGALERFDLDAEGYEVTDARKAGLSEDEIDDLVADYGFAVTPDGARVAEECATSERIERVCDAEDSRRAAMALLGFLRQPRDAAKLDAFCRKDPRLNALAEKGLLASQLFDALEKAGAMVWSDGWTLTDAGKQWLEGKEA